MKCPGCGVELQCREEHRAGYIPLDVLQRRKSEGKEILCQRCFWLKHYRKVKPVKLDQSVLDVLSEVIAECDFVAWIVDISDFEGSFDPQLQKLVSGKKVALVVNKLDLIPKSVSVQEIRDWLRMMVDSTNFEKVFLISAERNYGIRNLSRYLERFNRVCFIGLTNVGKSSIFNKLSGKQVNVTPFPGTTLDTISAKLRDSKTRLIDTPGLISSHRLMDLLPTECQAQMLAVKKLSRMTFKPEKDDVLFVSGMCVLEFSYNTELRPIFQVFSGEKVKFHLTNVRKKDHIWEKHYGKLLVPPCRPSQPARDKVVWSQCNFELDAGEELSVAGLGWLSVRRGPFTVKITVPEDVLVTKRNALVSPYRRRISEKEE